MGEGSSVCTSPPLGDPADELKGRQMMRRIVGGPDSCSCAWPSDVDLERGLDAALLTLLFVVVNLEHRHAAAVRQVDGFASLTHGTAYGTTVSSAPAVSMRR
jgi:hypothetical protein